MTGKVRRAPWLLLLVACNPEPEFEYETEHLRIAKSFDAPICTGTLRALETDAARISGQLGGTQLGRVDLILGEEAVADHCPEGSDGCALPGGPVWTNFGSAGHELVHAFADVAGRNPFIEEGLAEALGGGALNVHRLDGALDEEFALSDLLVDLGDVPYAIPGHFVVWLIDGWGLDAFLAFRTAVPAGATLSDISGAFEDTYEMSLESAELTWRNVAPFEYEVGQGCAGPSHAWIDARRWAHSLVADCEEPHTFGPLGDSTYVEAGMRRTVLIDVVEAGQYVLSADASRAGALEVSSYECGCWGGLESRDRYDLGDTRREITVELAPCRYRVSWIVAGVEPATVAVALERVEVSP